MTKNENLVKISVTDIQLGMYITAIEQKSQFHTVTAGKIIKSESIQKLQSNKIKYVWVDTEKSSPDCVFFPVTQDKKAEDSIEKKEFSGSELTDSERALKNRKARKLISEAKGLASRILHDTFDGKPVALGEVEEWADGVIDTIIEDSDALKFVSMLRTKDTYLLEHSVNVACLLVTFGKYLELDKVTLKYLAVGGMLHDIGKTKLKTQILNKPGKLSDEEFEHVKMHQVFAEKLIDDVEGLNQISQDVCLMHHEKLDGSGYPAGLKAEQIPLHGRMSAIIDIYDALTAERCYKKAMSPSDAFKILIKMTPFQLDQNLVYKFINCISVYPIGSLVELSDGTVGLVESVNEFSPLKPDVKCFYSNDTKQIVEITHVHLSDSDLEISKAVAPATLGIDISRYYT